VSPRTCAKSLFGVVELAAIIVGARSQSTAFNLLHFFRRGLGLSTSSRVASSIERNLRFLNHFGPELGIVNEQLGGFNIRAPDWIYL
jgi:hypothetical protein